MTNRTRKSIEEDKYTIEQKTVQKELCTPSTYPHTYVVHIKS